MDQAFIGAGRKISLTTKLGESATLSPMGGTATLSPMGGTATLSPMGGTATLCPMGGTAAISHMVVTVTAKVTDRAGFQLLSKTFFRSTLYL